VGVAAKKFFRGPLGPSEYPLTINPSYAPGVLQLLPWKPWYKTTVHGNCSFGPYNNWLP